MFSLKVNNLCKSFGRKKVLQGLSFVHEEGILGVAGPNGSGKSTLMKCLAWLLPPSSGSIAWLDGETPLDLKAVKNNIGFVAPYINLYHGLTVSENLEFVLRVRGRSFEPEEHDGLIDKLQLTSLREELFGELSTGQKQRARLACNLVHDPGIVLLDEPGANMDPKGLQMIEELMDEFRRKRRTVVLASNSREELDLSDRVISVTS